MIYGTTYLGKDFPFDIDAATGVISVSGDLDYKIQSRYDFRVTATMYLGYNHIVECTIHVTDLLDPVQCTSNPLLVEIREDTAPGNMSQCMNCSLPEMPEEKIRYFTSSSIITVDTSGLL